MLENMPKIGQTVTYKYCEMNDANLPTYPALLDDYIKKKNIGAMNVGGAASPRGKKNWKKLKMTRKFKISKR